MRTAVVVLGLVGLSLFIGLIAHEGFGEIVSAVAAAGWGLLAVARSHASTLLCDAAGWRCIRCDVPHGPVPNILTTHHFDGNKSNNAWWNLLALCQRCHLSVQGRVRPEQPYFLEHSDWIKPYVAGFYARKYLELDLTREQVNARMEELLRLEQMA